MVLFLETQQRLEFESCLGKRLASIFSLSLSLFNVSPLFLYKRVMHLGVACGSKGFGFVRLVGAQTPHMHPELQQKEKGYGRCTTSIMGNRPETD